MNNFGNENMGVLLHKLTKYQTLLSNCGAPAKSAIYNQKIDYYSRKLNSMGVSQNNLRNVRNLIGGMPTLAERETALASLQRELDDLGGINVPQSPLDTTTGDADIAQLVALIDEIDVAHQANIAKIQQLQQDKASLDSQVATKDAQISALETEKQQALSEVSTKVAEIANLTQERDNKITEIANLTQAIQQNLSDIATKDSKITTLEQEKQALTTEKDGLERLIDSIIPTIRRQIEQLRTKFTSQPSARIVGSNPALQAALAKAQALKQAVSGTP